MTSEAAWITQIERDVRQAEADLAEARAQRDYLKGAFLTDPLTFATDPDGDCWFCGTPTEPIEDHDEVDMSNDCPVTKARAFLRSASERPEHNPDLLFHDDVRPEPQP